MDPLAAAEGLNMGLLALEVGEELEIPGEVIPVGNDPAFAAFRDPENSDSDLLCTDRHSVSYYLKNCILNP